MKQHSVTQLTRSSIFTLGALALAMVSAASIAAPHQSHSGGMASHSSVSVNVGGNGHYGNYGRGGYYRSGYRGYYGRGYGYGYGYGYRPYGWGGFYSGLSLGLVVPFLPYGYATTWYGGSPYYYADDVYYVSNPGRGYRVVAAPDSQFISENYVYDTPGPAPVVAAPPSGSALTNIQTNTPTNAPTPSYVQPGVVPPTSNQTPAPAQLYAYPKNGQTATQATFDRIECERWGSGQTGFNPGQSAADSARKADYSRAVSACLEGRGYTVK